MISLWISRCWPSFESASSWYNGASWIFLLSLAFGAVAAFLIYLTGNAKEDYLKRNIAGSIERAAIAERQAAEANKRTEQLRADNLALQAGVRPRRLSFMGWTTWPERVAKIYDDLKIHAGTTALIQVVPDFEAQLFAKDIAMVLEQNGWKPRFVTEKESHMSDLNFPQGITIFTLSDGKTQTHAGIALWNALLDAAHEMGAQPFEGAPTPVQEINSKPKPGYPHFEPPITAVFLRVGIRQLTSQFLEVQQREIIRGHEEYINGLKEFVKHGRKLLMPATDGGAVEAKIGPDGNLVSVDPNRKLESLFNLTLLGWSGGDLPKSPSSKKKNKP